MKQPPASSSHHQQAEDRNEKVVMNRLKDEYVKKLNYETATAEDRHEPSGNSCSSPAIQCHPHALQEKGETQRHTALQGSGQVRRRGGASLLPERKECVTVCQGAVDLLRVPDQTKNSEPSARPQLPIRWAPRAAMLNGQSLMWLGSWTQCPGCPANGCSEGDISEGKQNEESPSMSPSNSYSHASPNRRATPEAPQQLSLNGAVWQCFDGPADCTSGPTDLKENAV